MLFSLFDSRSRGALSRAAAFLLVIASLVLACALVPGASARVAYASDLTAAASIASAKSGGPAAAAEDGLYHVTFTALTGYSMGVWDDSGKARAKAALVKVDDANWSQKWILLRDGATGFYTVRNLKSRLLLGVSGKAKAGSYVVQQKQAKKRSAKQLWKLVAVGDGVVLCSAARSSLCIAAYKAKGGFDLKLKKLKGAKKKPAPGKSQRFTLRKAVEVEDGHSFYLWSAKSGKALGIPNDSRKQRAQLCLEAKSPVRNQKFRLVKSGNAYLVQCASSCMYLGTNGKDVRQYKGEQGKAKQWNVSLDLKTGTFAVESAKFRGKCIDARSVKTRLARRTGGKAQRYILVPTYGFKLYVDPGHGWYSSIYDPGAEGNGREEADLTKDLAKRLETQLEGSDVLVVNGSQFHLDYWRRNAKAASLGCNAVLSIHFDSDGSSTTSTMVGTSGPTSLSRAFNKIVHPALVSGVGLPDGGTSTRSDITIVNGSVPAVLMEVCFIDDSGSLSKYLARRDTVAASLAQAVVDASRTLAF